jgi:septum site-determining protein MinC
VRFSGDVVLFGDVNAGAQVIADGDIVVLGRLRGLAHAGSRGDSTAVVVGLDMQSGQVRIGDAIAFPEKSEEPMATSRLNNLLRRSSPHPQRFVSPSVARVVDGQIRIEDYHGRLHA